jgi:hypothetical protein
MGVDTVWQLELPKAATLFDCRGVADVVLTIEYSALPSVEYREPVIHEIERRFSGDRTFSIRNQFPDAWYELNNPETVDPDHRMRVTLPLTADDFPPHIQDPHVEHLSLFAVRADALADELTILSLRSRPRDADGDLGRGGHERWDHQHPTARRQRMERPPRSQPDRNPGAEADRRHPGAVLVHRRAD